MATISLKYSQVKVKKRSFKRITSRWQLYLFILLPLILTLVFAYYPMFGIQLAFKKFDSSLGIWGSPFVGLDQFIKFFKSYMFSRVIINTLSLSLYGLIAGFPIPIIFALMLNAMKNQRYKKFIQTVTYIPHFISTVVMVGMIMQFLNPRIGAFGLIYKALTGITAPDLMGSSATFAHIYIWSGIWQGLGWSSIIYIAALSSVDTELYEAARIDGANRFKQMLHIDLPSILPTAIMLLILSAGSIMNVGFEKVFLMQNSLNSITSEIISTYVYKIGLASSVPDYSYSTAIGLFNSVVNLILIAAVNYVSKRFSQQSLW